MKSSGIRLFTAVVASVAGGVLAPTEALAELARIPLNDYQLVVRRDGGLTLSHGERVLVRGSRLVLAGEGWRGSVSQANATAAEGFPRRTGMVCEFRGSMAEPVAGVSWSYRQRVEPVEDGVRVEYVVSPTADCRLSEACLFLDLPVASWSGRPLLLWPSAEGVFPAERPARRHFLSGAAKRLVLGAPGPGRLGFAFDGATLCTVQDGREFGSDCYQAYPRILIGREAKAGQEYRLAFTIQLGDLTEAGVPGVVLESRGEPGLNVLGAEPPTVSQYDRFEVSFQASGTWDNPYDPDQIAIDADFRGPDGRQRTVPAFLFQDYERMELNDVELLVPRGPPVWKVRFAPPVPGTWSWSLRLDNQGRSAATLPQTFVCTPAADRRGYVRVSRTNPHYFEYDDGTPFFGIGMNVATLDWERLASADRWYTRFAEAGGNFVRSWWCASGTDLESEVSSRADTGLGKYRQEDSWRIDYLLGLCERLGMTMMCCIETQQALRRDAWWGRFTYNRANGGPLDAPADFFTDPEAARLFRNRLRYIVARWSYSTAVQAWQFWNEVNASNDFRVEPVAAWHREMAVYLRSIDPAAHVIYTNFGNLDGHPEIDSLPEMEAVSTNIYSRRNMAQTGIWATRTMTARYRKPFLLTEYGVGHRGGWVSEDPTGIIVHNGLWGPLFSGGAGTGMPWGWGYWIDRQEMYHYWRPVAEFVAGVPFSRRQWQPVRVSSFTFRDVSRPPYHADVFVEGWPRNYSFTLCPPQRPEVFEIDAEGELRDEASLSAVLRAGEQSVFAADFPVDGAFVVHVPEISERGEPTLRIEIDGRESLSQPLPRGDGKPWEYWRAFSVPVSAGPRRLAVGNTGSGVIWTAYELQRFRRREGPDLDVAGMFCEDTVLLWLRNPQFIWLCERQGRPPPPQPAGVLVLDGIADGEYAATWFRTTNGENLGTATVTAQAGRLRLDTPAITRSAVAKLVRR